MPCYLHSSLEVETGTEESDDWDLHHADDRSLGIWLAQAVTRAVSPLGSTSQKTFQLINYSLQSKLDKPMLRRTFSELFYSLAEKHDQLVQWGAVTAQHSGDCMVTHHSRWHDIE